MTDSNLTPAAQHYFRVTRRFHFDAAHQLRKHPGECRHLHGHRWEFDVTVEGRPDPVTGIVVDFKDMKHYVEKHILKELDHTCINNTLYFERIEPTAENLAYYIFHKLNSEGGLHVKQITVYESPGCSVTYDGI